MTYGKHIKLEAINTQQLLLYQLLIYIVHKMVKTFRMYININMIFHVSIRSYHFLMCFMELMKPKHTHTDRNNNKKQNMLMTSCIYDVDTYLFIHIYTEYDFIRNFLNTLYPFCFSPPTTTRCVFRKWNDHLTFGSLSLSPSPRFISNSLIWCTEKLPSSTHTLTHTTFQCAFENFAHTSCGAEMPF